MWPLAPMLWRGPDFSYLWWSVATIETRGFDACESLSMTWMKPWLYQMWKLIDDLNEALVVSASLWYKVETQHKEDFSAKTIWPVVQRWCGPTKVIWNRRSILVCNLLRWASRPANLSDYGSNCDEVCNLPFSRWADERRTQLVDDEFKHRTSYKHGHEL